MDKDNISKEFGQAQNYDQHAKVQPRVAAKLAARIAGLNLPPAPRILEIGCGTGHLSTDLYRRLPGAIWTITDLAQDMVDRTRAKLPHAHITYATLDGEQVQEIAGPFDLICSSMAFQWFADLPKTVANLSAILAPKGHLAFSTMAEGSFAEWRLAHADLGFVAATPGYPSAPALAAMAPADSAVIVTVEDEIEQHADSRAFLRSLKEIGATTPRAGHKPLSTGQMRQVMRRFDAQALARYQIAYAVYSRA